MFFERSHLDELGKVNDEDLLNICVWPKLILFKRPAFFVKEAAQCEESSRHARHLAPRLDDVINRSRDREYCSWIPVDLLRGYLTIVSTVLR